MGHPPFDQYLSPLRGNIYGDDRLIDHSNPDSTSTGCKDWNRPHPFWSGDGSQPCHWPHHSSSGWLFVYCMQYCQNYSGTNYQSHSPFPYRSHCSPLYCDLYPRAFPLDSSNVYEIGSHPILNLKSDEV